MRTLGLVRLGVRAAPLLVAGLGLLTTGCPAANIYGSPRTTPEGKFSGFGALEGVGYTVKTKNFTAGTDTTLLPATTYKAFVPQAPTFGGRYGAIDRLDVGLKLSGFTTPGMDVKWNFLQSDFFDLAVDPGVEYAPFLATRVQLPLLAGVNFSDKVSLVLSPGVTYGITAFSDGKNDRPSEFEEILGSGGWYGRIGIGLDVRFNKKVGMHPAITFVKALKPQKDIFESVLTYTVGIGLTFGSLPHYGPPDAEEKPEGPMKGQSAPAGSGASDGSAAPASSALPAAPPAPDGAATPGGAASPAK